MVSAEIVFVSLNVHSSHPTTMPANNPSKLKTRQPEKPLSAYPVSSISCMPRCATMPWSNVSCASVFPLDPMTNTVSCGDLRREWQWCVLAGCWRSTRRVPAYVR
eukprot:354196-Chlamydomonas_euryale.AAC.3